MKQIQLSVFYHGYYLSYEITTDDSVLFHFTLKSAPEDASYAPAAFTVTHAKRNWQFDPALDTEFQDNVVHTLKRAKA